MTLFLVCFVVAIVGTLSIYVMLARIGKLPARSLANDSGHVMVHANLDKGIAWTFATLIVLGLASGIYRAWQIESWALAIYVVVLAALFGWLAFIYLRKQRNIIELTDQEANRMETPMKLFFRTSFAFSVILSAHAHAECVKSTDPWAIVHAQDVAYNAHDVDAFADCYSDDAVIEGLSSTHPPTVGIAQLKQSYKFLKTAPKGFHTKFINKMIVGPIVVVHEVVLGGPSNWPKPDWPKESIAIFEVRNSKVIHVWFPPWK